MQFGIEACFDVVVHRYIDYTLHGQRHFADIADIVAVGCCQSAGVGGEIHPNHVGPHGIVPLAVAYVGTHVADDMDTSLRRSVQSAVPVGAERSVCGGSYECFGVFLVFGEDTGVDYIIHF